MLSRSADVDLVVVNFDLEARWQERIEPYYEVRVSLEQVGYPADHTWCVDALDGRGW